MTALCLHYHFSVCTEHANLTRDFFFFISFAHHLSAGANLSYYIEKAEGLSLYTQLCILRSGFLRGFTIACLRHQVGLMMG